MKTIILMVFCFLSLSLFSQKYSFLLDKIDCLKNDSTCVSYDFIYANGPQGIVENITGRGIVKFMKSDTMQFHHNIWFQNQYGVFQQIYNGKQLAFISHSESDYNFINLDSFKQGYSLITGNIVSSFRPEFLFDSTYFSFLQSNEGIDSIALDTVFVYGKNCFQLKVKFEDNGITQNNYSFYYFNRKSFFPIGYKYLFEIGGSKMEQSFIIFNVVTHENKNPDIFNYKIYDDFGYRKNYFTKKTEAIEEEKEIIKDTLRSTGFDFDRYKGKVLVLDFWYIGCAPCLMLIPVMEKLYSEFPDVAFIGINKGDKPEKIKKFVEKRGIKYPVFPDETGLVKKYNMNSFPQVFIYNKTGNLIKRFEGYSDSIYDQIKSVIEEELKK